MNANDEKLKNPTFIAAETSITLCDDTNRQPRPEPGQKIAFGHFKSDHMAVVDFDAENNVGWGTPRIVPFGDLAVSPCSPGLHYGFQVFEGIKAYRSERDRNNFANIFRLDQHVERFLGSCLRMSMPGFDVNEMRDLIKKLVSIDFDCIPEDKYSSLYIRPLIFATEATFGVSPPRKVKLVIFTGPVLNYYSEKDQDVSDPQFKINLVANPEYIRAWPGGAGAYKTGCNYGPTMAVQKQALEKFNATQVLWLFQNKITEIGTMNVFVSLLLNGKRILATPSLQDGIILPGITRKTIIELCQRIDLVDEFAERDIYFDEIVNLLKNPDEQNRVLGIFGSGTAAVICPVNSLTVYNENHTQHYSFPFDSTLCNTLLHLITSLQRCAPVEKLDQTYINSLKCEVKRF